MQAATNENRLMKTTCRYDVLNQQPLMAKAIEGGEPMLPFATVFAMNSNPAGEVGFLSAAMRAQERASGTMSFLRASQRFKKPLERLQRCLLVKLGVFNRTLANQRHNF